MTRTSEHDRDAPDIARLVRGAAEGDRRAWERLVDQYARLIWSITADFKLIESDAADVAQTTWLRLLEHIDRIQYPDRVGSWLAATARNECLRSLAARKRVVLAHDDEVLTDVVASAPEVDERILADERDSGGSRRAVPPAPALAAAARAAHGRSAGVLRRHIQRARTFPSAASAPPGDDAWPGCASCCRLPELKVPATWPRQALARVRIDLDAASPGHIRRHRPERRNWRN